MKHHQEFSKFEIIPSIRKLNNFDAACNSGADYVLLTEASISNLQMLVRRVHESGKKAWVNPELLGGFDCDHEGAKLLHNLYHVDGVMSTDTRTLSLVKRQDIYTIQRFFVTDSRAFETALKVLDKSPADCAEILPAFSALEVYHELKRKTDLPLLAGGFIKNEEMLEKIREIGYNGVTVSEKRLWPEK
ncbi:MAG: glycerol-3-phosphate responsive antiterminator [Eubacteriaceae bacterium]|jgi:glycerol uptake operon antiterminator